MKDIDKLLRNKRIVIGIVVLLMILCIFIFAALNDNTVDNDAIYGTRLDVIKNNKINKNKISDIENNIKTSDKVKSVKVYVKGRIINAEIKLKDDATRDDGKVLTDKIVEKLSDEEKKLYDIQVFINKDKDETFPIIGYRHHNKDGFSWTLDR